jgi:hypothetical protein
VMRLNSIRIAAGAGTLFAALSGCGARGHGVGTDAAPIESGIDGGPCIGTCEPDPGSATPNCAAEEAGLEFFPSAIWDFESGKGDYMYEYTDRSTTNFAPRGYAPPATAIDRCGSRYAMHIYGGPFRGWGGGVGIAMSHLHDAQICPDGCPSNTAAVPYAYATLNFSKWDGISFWARRGPNGQSAIRLGIGDHHTDDDISFLMYNKDKTTPRFCERNLECGCTNRSKTCSNYAGDSQGSLQGTYCWNPTTDPPPTATLSELGDHYSYPTCAKTKCNEPYPAYASGIATDPAFEGRPCTPYQFPNGAGASYCFDPATDPPPYDTNQTCGDHWVFPVALTTDWHLYVVPFTVLQQQGFGKKFTRPDLAVVSLLRFMWDVGWVDYWIDDVRLYRAQK